MKATGIVRRMDPLGRIVLPKEICRTFGINPGDPMEIFTDDGGHVILRKFSYQGRAHDAAALIYDLAVEMPPAVSGKVRDWANSIMDTLDANQ